MAIKLGTQDLSKLYLGSNEITKAYLGISQVLEDVLWTPDQISNYMWFDSSDASTITHSSGFVSQWDDKSGNARNATQVSASSQPTTGLRTLNRLNAITFDGSNDYMVTGGSAALDRTIISVAQYDSTSGLRIIAGSRDSTNERSYFGQENGRNRVAAGNRFAGGEFLESNPIIQVFTHGSDLKKNSWMNGNKDTTYDNVSFSGPIGSVQPYYLGTLNSAGYAYSKKLRGLICELNFIDSVISESDRQKFEGYLAWKWGLVADLDTSHPYKFSPPTV